MMLRVLARFSCLALQKRWTNALKESLETLCADDNLAVKMVTFSKKINSLEVRAKLK